VTDPDAHHAISAAEVQRIARLARLELSPDRVQSLTHDLAKVVAYVDRVRELDLANVEPMTHVGDAANRLAPDEPGRVLETEVLTRMAPAHDGPFVQVPKILDDHGGGA
jgi:aspartyl-tRNA(Asn)/glutamyl-tRNA(Gln) amidotransferase subunit C